MVVERKKVAGTSTIGICVGGVLARRLISSFLKN